ncbi:MAG: cytochrome c maturation protein CcmE [Rhodobacteraceae bacterium]|nr:cytochrome c maturation protein CcmE [Paracoccaceae bacterium]
MPSYQKKRRIQLIGIAAILVIFASVLIGYGFREGISFFRTPSEIIMNNPDPREVFRVGGLVAEDSIESVGSMVTFRIKDADSSISVQYTGILPDLFAENQGAIALGTFDGETFQATEVLARHDEKYIPKEVVDALKEKGIYQPVNE